MLSVYNGTLASVCVNGCERERAPHLMPMTRYGLFHRPSRGSVASVSAGCRVMIARLTEGALRSSGS
jgi:hypothetical protein